MAGRQKIYELAKELELDSRQVLEVAQRLSINIKNPTSFIGSEEARLVREYFKKVRAVSKKAPVTKTKKVVSEQRVGKTIIRRRSKASPPPAPPEEAKPVEPEQAAPPIEAPAEPVVVEKKAVEASEVPVEKPKKEPFLQKIIKTVEKKARKAVKKEAEPEAEKPEKEAKRKKEAKPKKEAKTKKAAPKEKQAPEQVVEVEAAATPEEEPVVETQEDRKKKWSFPSIIKRKSTEEHLGETIGPKRAKKPVKPAAKGAAGAAASGTDKAGEKKTTGPKRVREITMGFQAPTTKETGKRRMLQQRQNGVFRTSDFLKRELIRSGRKKKIVMNRPAMKPMLTTPSAKKRVVQMEETIGIEALAKEMGVKIKQMYDKLRELGAVPEEAQVIDHDTAVIIATEFGYTIKQNLFKEEELLPPEEGEPEDLKARAPVVTIMGHVDHGKTSLLDKIRKTKVAEGEAGGITQHVGAYSVKLKKGTITFVDTPGHEAFTAMRARGAQVTDIVILVVAASEGVMPQTLESVNHSKAAGVPVIVAVNKMDLPDANPDRVKQTLAGHGLNPEEWGGDTLYVNVSAKTGDGIDALLESILLQAEMLELKADYKVPARGIIIESRVERGRGTVATVLIQSGNLKAGVPVICGTVIGKVRAISDFQGKKIKSASPSDAVEIIGLSEVVEVGETLHVVPDEKTAREVIAARKVQKSAESAEAKPKLTLEEMLAAEVEKKELRAVLKSDVHGSIEAVKESLSKFPREKVDIRYLHEGVGGITENDVMLASASQGVILGFNVRPDTKAKQVAEREGVQIKCFRVIYELIAEVKALLEGLVDKKVVEKVIGRAEVRDVFQIPKIGAVAGSSVVDGKMIRGCFLRLTRDSRVVYEGKVSSLRRFKDDVREVTKGTECGIGLENFNDIKNGDQMEAYEKEEVAGTL